MADELYGRKLFRTHVCQTCKREFQASRIDAQYCSGRCRVYWQRHGAPYPGRGTPKEVGPGLFDEVKDDTASQKKQTADYYGALDKVAEHMMNPIHPLELNKVLLDKAISAIPKPPTKKKPKRTTKKKPKPPTKNKGVKKNARKK